MKNALLLIILFGLSLACNRQKGQRVNFDLIPNQATPIVITEKPLHYKYSKVESDTILYQADKKIGYDNLKSVPRVVTLSIGEFSFPLYLDGKSRLLITIDRTNRKQPIQIEGYPEGLLETYLDLLKTEKPMQEGLLKQRTAFNKGEANTYVRILDDIQLNRKSVLTNTPYEFLYWASYGEYLVARVNQLDKEKVPLKDRYAIRNALFEEAKLANFFTLKSLESQRAGIRDFTNAWAHSFGIADSVKKATKKDLLIYDVNRVAYEILNKRRSEVVIQIESENAKAYAELYLVAERLAEGNFLEGQKSMTQFTQLYLDNFPKYVDWIIEFHDEVMQVQAGMDAFDFTFPDENGKMRSFSEFKGKVIFLDFWASWCSPCLHEFPYMKEIYSKLDRSKVEFVGIGLDEDQATWEATISTRKLPWVQLYGGKELKNELFRKYKGGGIPLVVLIDSNGKIASYNDIRASYNLEEKLGEFVK